VGGQPHILHPKGQPARWSTVTVQADSAALADGLSTALVFATRDQTRRIRDRLAGVQTITLIDTAGDLTTI
jgi:thiamine biosynthesis lipoprotein